MKELRKEDTKHREHMEIERKTETGKETQLKTDLEPQKDLDKEKLEIQVSESED